MDLPGHASMARYSYLTGGPWMDRYHIAAFAWVVPVDFRETYQEVYALSLVKGKEGEVADVDLEI
jgi:hypothetical protein